MSPFSAVSSPDASTHRTAEHTRPGAPPSSLRSALSIGVLAVFGALLVPATCRAQSTLLSRLSVEPRVGVAFPTGDFGNVDPSCPPGTSGCPYPLQVGTETGWRWGVRALLALTPSWSLVAEYGHTTLGCSATFCGTEKSPGTRSVGVGVRSVVYPLGSMDIWVEGAAALEEVTIIRTQDGAGDPASIRVSYPWAAGLSVGLGAELDLKGDEVLFFTPGFRFRYAPADPPASHPDLASITATYALFEVGFRVVLGRS